MQIKVISIIDSERSLSVVERLCSLGFSPNLMPATDFREKELTDLRDVFDIEIFQDRYGRLPTAGEIGCTLSHLSAMRSFNVNDLSRGGVVFEDDAMPRQTSIIFENIYEEILLSPFDIVVLGYSKADDNTEAYFDIVNPFLPVFKTAVGPYNVGVRYQRSTSGAVGYVVKNSSQSILSRIEKPSYLADDWDYYSSLGLSIGYLKPTLVREDTLGLKSTLGHDIGYIAPRHHDVQFIHYLLIFRRKLIGLYRRCIMRLMFTLKISKYHSSIK
jgi:glycosyl transferase family 25